MEKLLNLKQFQKNRRDLLLDYKIYEENFNECVDTFEVVTRGRANPHPDSKPVNAMTSTEQRAWDAVDHLTTCYSAGHTVDELGNFYMIALHYWEEYAKYHETYHDSVETEAERGFPHFGLPEAGDFYRTNRMVCFAILLGHGQLLPRLVSVIDYNNHQLDGMLERLFAFYVDGRSTPPDECTRHLPYFKTLKIFNAAPKDRPELMAEYLEDWYEASRREYYHDSHERRTSFLGYWSWEAAAITFLLNIDDASYKDAQFYPKDLVEFARNLNAKGPQPAGSTPLAKERQRCEGGQPCPETGLWFTPAKTDSQQIFRQGDKMPIYNTDYGATIWYWVQGQVRHS